MVYNTANFKIHFGTAAKNLALLACLGLFLHNACHTYETYLDKRTLESTSIEPFPNEGMMNFPTLVMCDLFAFKNRSKVMLSIEDYEENTFDSKDFIESIGWQFWESQTETNHFTKVGTSSH